MASESRRRRVEPTDEWEQVELLCAWPEQRDYELIRPLVLFGAPGDGRAEENRGVLRTHAATQSRPLGGGGHGEFIRLGGGNVLSS